MNYAFRLEWVKITYNYEREYIWNKGLYLSSLLFHHIPLFVLPIKKILPYNIKPFWPYTNITKGRGKKNPLNLWSWSYLAGPPTPLFWELWSPKVIFFLRCFLINWVSQVCLETHFEYVWNKLWLEKALKKPLSLWSWSYLAGVGWKRQDLYGHLYWK